MHSTQPEAGLGQFAVITGGAGGLGRAIAHRLARAGVVSALWDIDAAKAARGWWRGRWSGRVVGNLIARCLERCQDCRTRNVGNS